MKKEVIKDNKMTREIKFRAWDEKDKELISGDTLGELLYKAKSGLDVDYVVDNFKWMQYTGLKDKNGKEIYEGDVCKWPSGINRQIIWDEVNACFSTPLHTLQVERGQSTVIGHHLEVIGNIYENPELLKQNA